MKYLLLIYLEEQVWNKFSESEKQQRMRDGVQFAHELKASGKLQSAAPLQPVATATSVRLQKGQRLVTDGPFAETREQLGGYFLIDVASRDEAIDIVARMKGDGPGTIEIRPVVEIPGVT